MPPSLARPRHRPRRGSGALRKLRPLIILATLVLVTGSLYLARPVLMPVAVAMLLTFLLSPAVVALQRRGVARTLSVLVVVLLTVSVLGGVGWLLAIQVKNLANELPKYQDNIRQKIADVRWAGRGTVLDRLQRMVNELLGEMKKQEPGGGGQDPVPVVIQSDKPALIRQLPTLMESLVTVGLVIALVIFMLIRRQELRDRLIRLGGGRRLPLTTRALDEAGERISHYLSRLSIINSTFGAAVGLGLFLIGLPYALLWGFLAGLLRFIPYVGPWLAAILPSLLALAVFDGWVQPLLVIGLFAVVEPTIFLVIEPIFYGAGAGISEVALLIAVGFWTWLWGPVGLVLATPLTVCLVVLGKHVRELEFLVILMGDEPVLETHVRYYQRLLAEDQDEAAQIVEGYVAEHPLERVYDELLVPALKCAKRDRARDELPDEEEQFVLSATREIVEELETRPLAEAGSPAGRAQPSPAPRAAGDGGVRVLGCPARDEVDELALVMLRHLLAGTRCELTIAGSELTSAELVALVRETRPAAICVAALPPGGVARTRYLVKRLRATLPEAKILVGRWGRNGNHHEETRAHLLSAGADEVGTTLLETREQLAQLLPAVGRRPRPARTA